MPVPDAALAPDYPPLLSVLGVDGQCEVMFDVEADGSTSDILTNCTLPAFGEATTNMLDPLEFSAGAGASSPATEDILLPVNYCAPEKAE